MTTHTTNLPDELKLHTPDIDTTIRNVYGDTDPAHEWTDGRATELITDHFPRSPHTADDIDTTPHPADGAAGIYYPTQNDIWISNRELFHHGQLERVIWNRPEYSIDNLPAVMFRCEYTALRNTSASLTEDITGLDPQHTTPTALRQRLIEESNGTTIRRADTVDEVLGQAFIPSIDVPALPFETMAADTIERDEITIQALYTCVYTARTLGMPRTTLLGFRHQPRQDCSNPHFQTLGPLYDELDRHELLPDPLVTRNVPTVTADIDAIRGRAREIL